MPLFGKKKDKTMDLPEVADFSNDTWSFKGEVPVYQIQSDGFSYDVTDADGNDKNAISLGLAGMLIIVLNAKGPKIKEEELVPNFAKVIKTRNWHTMTLKEANFLAQTAAKKLSSAATSGDVFDLASYAPLEVKRVLLKTLFTMSRVQMKPEFREEAEHRIIDDIVPAIFAVPDYELALLTNLIVKPDAKPKEQSSGRLTTTPVLDPDPRYSRPIESEMPQVNIAGEDSAFAQLQRIYGATPAAPAAAAQAAPAAPEIPAQQPAPPVNAESAQNASVAAPQASQPVSQPGQQPVSQQPAENAAGNEGQSVSHNAPQAPAQNFSGPQPVNPFARVEPKSIPQPQTPNFSGPQPNNPFAQGDSRSIPQPPNFGGPQPANPFMPADGRQGIPQPPAPGYGMQPNMPYGNMNAQPGSPVQNQGFPQGNPFQGGFQPFQPQQPWQQNPQQAQQNPQSAQGVQNQGPQQPFYPGQMRPPYPQMPQNMGGAYQQNFNPAQGGEGNTPPWMMPGRNPQQPPQSGNTSENA